MNETQQRIRIDLAYHGAAFCGWQIQPNQRSVQGELMSALKKLYGREVLITGAGRTDAGVHALQQVAHLDLPRENCCELSHQPIDNKTCQGPHISLLARALNALTPPEMSVLNVEPVSSDFHARFSPHIKTYAYHFDLHQQPHPLLRDRAWHCRERDLNHEKMRIFCDLIVGTHDFGSFCSIQNSTETTVRTLVGAEMKKSGPSEWVFSVRGKGFLQHMVRILAGTLLGVGMGKIQLEVVGKILSRGSGFREQLGLTLPAHGLWLEKTEYVEGQDGLS